MAPSVTGINNFKNRLDITYIHAYIVVSRPRPNREPIFDVVQEGQSLKLGVGWRARLFIPTCNNSKH